MKKALILAAALLASVTATKAVTIEGTITQVNNNRGITGTFVSPDYPEDYSSIIAFVDGTIIPPAYQEQGGFLDGKLVVWFFSDGNNEFFWSTTGTHDLLIQFQTPGGIVEGTANYTILPIATPDGGATAALLGLGVAGLALVRRKL
jgi:hypothetical protein